MKDRKEELIKDDVEETCELAKKVDKVLSGGYKKVVALNALCFLLGRVGLEICDTNEEINFYLDVIKDKIRIVCDKSKTE